LFEKGNVMITRANEYFIKSYKQLRLHNNSFLLFIVLCLFASTSLAASFDCKKASKPVEKLICSNAELSVLDEKLSVVYARYVATSPNPTTIISEQRKWLLSNRDSCKNSQCAITAYKERLNALEIISGGYSEIPDSRFIKTLCEKLMDESARRKILQNQKNVADINNDGHEEILKTCSGGTMHVPCTDYFSRKGKRIDISAVNYERLDWVLSAQSFRYGGRTFSILYSDYELQNPLSLTYVTPLNEEHALCKFNTLVSSIPVESPGSNDDVCRAFLDSPDLIEPIHFSGDTQFVKESIQLTKSGRKYSGREYSYVKTSGTADINNDGKQENVVELEYYTSAGRGCNFNYYDLLDKSGTQFSSEEMRSIFLELQGMTEIDFFISGCGRTQNRLFQYRNRIYFERNVTQEEGEGAISILSENQIKTVCSFNRTLIVEGFKQVGSASMYFNE